MMEKIVIKIINSSAVSPLLHIALDPRDGDLVAHVVAQLFIRDLECFDKTRCLGSFTSSDNGVSKGLGVLALLLLDRRGFVLAHNV